MNFPKFRVFDKSQNKYLTICIDYYTLKYQGDVWFLCPLSQNDKYWPMVAISSLDKNNNNFVMEQYTGLEDKNGQEIYEGDILQEKWTAPCGKMETKYIIRYGTYENGEDWKQIGFYMRYVLDSVQKEGESGSGLSPNNKRWKIIGNIYENPELLK